MTMFWYKGIRYELTLYLDTLRKAVAYGKLVNGVDVCKYVEQWVVSVEAMKREYGCFPTK